MTPVPSIASVEAALVRLPLPQPLRFEAGSWSHWYYAVARVTTADGVVGSAYTHIGEVPVDVMVTELMAPALVERADR